MPDRIARWIRRNVSESVSVEDVRWLRRTVVDALYLVGQEFNVSKEEDARTDEKVARAEFVCEQIERWIRNHAD